MNISNRRVPIIEILAALTVAFLYAGHAFLALIRNQGDAFIDLRPMYCAGAAMRAHANPYTVEPIASCQIALGALAGSSPLPAPLPPFALEPFALLASFSFRVVGSAYIVLAIVAFGCAVYWTASLARVRWSIAALVLFWTGFYFAANLGQLSIIALAAVAGTAFYVEKRRYFKAGFLSTLTLLQPTLAVPLIVVLALAQPRSRGGLGCGMGLVAILAVFAGPALNLYYLRAELPSHAASEVYMPFQFSATWLAAALGASPTSALLLGSISYIAALALAVVAGLVFTKRGRPALAILYAVSAATVGGAFIHLSQLAAALPAGLVLASRAQRGRTIISAATCVLGAEWLSTWYQTVARSLAITLVKSVMESLAFAALLRGGGASRARSIFGGGLFVGACLIVAWIVVHQPLGPPTLARSDAGRLAAAGPLLSDRWRVSQEDMNRGRTVTRITVTKAVPWIALVVIVAFGAAAFADDTILRPPDGPLTKSPACPL